jgi:hypothetical protein
MNKTTNDFLMRTSHMLNLKHEQQTRKQIEWYQQQMHQNEQKWRHLHQQQQVCQQMDFCSSFKHTSIQTFKHSFKHSRFRITFKIPQVQQVVLTESE